MSKHNLCQKHKMYCIDAFTSRKVACAQLHFSVSAVAKSPTCGLAALTFPLVSTTCRNMCTMATASHVKLVPLVHIYIPEPCFVFFTCGPTSLLLRKT